jgi:hypothetical protein
MPTLTPCPLGEILPIDDGVCPPGATLDQNSGCCIVPSAQGFLEIPSVYPPPPAPCPSVVYSGNPYSPRGLPPSVAGYGPTGASGALGGFASVIPILVGLLGVAFSQWINKPATPPPPPPPPPPPKVCAPGEYNQPCRPHEQLDKATGCCATICPSGEYAQPCRPNETVDQATNCCMLPAAGAGGITNAAFHPISNPLASSAG